MKRKLRSILALAAVGLCALSGVAHAQQFSLTSSFLNLNGNGTGDFRWTVTPQAISNINLAVNQSQTFTYGIFNTSSFPLDSDETDSFTSRLQITPPNAPTDETGTINADGYSWDILGWFDGAKIDFDNNPNLVNFGNGGKYSVAFLDPGTLCDDGSLNLQATIKLLCDSTPAPVPEPGTMMLLGAGFLGLAVYSKRRKNA